MRACCAVALLILGRCLADADVAQTCREEIPLGDVTSFLQLQHLQQEPSGGETLDGPRCMVTLFHRSACQGDGSSFATTSTTGKEFRFDEVSWQSARIVGDCDSVELYDEDAGERGYGDNMLIFGAQECVGELPWDLGGDVSGLYVTAADARLPRCRVTLFREAGCRGGSRGLATSRAAGQEFALGDDDWRSARIEGDCASVEFYDQDEDRRGYRDNLQVQGTTKCEDFSWDLGDDLSGLYIIPSLEKQKRLEPSEPLGKEGSASNCSTAGCAEPLGEAQAFRVLQDGRLEDSRDVDGVSYIGIHIKSEARCGQHRLKLGSGVSPKDCAALAREAGALTRPALAYSLARGPGAARGECWAETEVTRSLAASWQRCKDEPPCANPECPLGSGWVPDPGFDLFYLEEEE